MAITVYLSPLETDQVTALDPLTITLDGNVGGAIDKKLYIRNDDLERWYDGIVVTAVDSNSPSIVNGSRWNWKFIEKDIAPVNEEWFNTVAGNSLTLSAGLGSNTAGDIGTYLPFWLRVTVPEDQRSNNITSVVIRISATEHLVTG